MVSLGIDGGNCMTKTASERGVDLFRSNIIPYRDLKLDSKHGDDDMVVEYQGKRYFAGSKAKYEDLYDSETLSGDSKNHDEAKLRILIAVHRNVDDGDSVKLIVGQPISKHSTEETSEISKRLIGEHEMTINGKVKKFWIEEAKVAPEGASAFWASPKNGTVRMLDIGSGTVNCATLLDQRYIDAKSCTLTFGMETDEESNPGSIAEAIIRKLSKKWKKKDSILVCGGGAVSLIPFIETHFSNAKLFHPAFQNQIISPIYANAVGFYTMAQKVFGNGN